MHILCIGLGAIGKTVAEQLAQAGHQITGISRSDKPHLHPNITHITADILSSDFSLHNILQTYNQIQNIKNQTQHAQKHIKDKAKIMPISGWDRVIITLTPSNYSEQGYYQAYLTTAQKLCQELNQLITTDGQVIFISSTGVFGENKAEVCHEETPAKPNRYNGQAILAAEDYYRTHFGHQFTTIRPSGIYGVYRLRLLKLLDHPEKLANIMQSQHWSNRIFDTDLVNIICHITQQNHFKPCYHATDSTPVLQHQVMTFLAKKLHKPLPTFNKQAEVTGKRIINQYIPSTWYAYPDWQTGYQFILQKTHPNNGT